MSEAGAQQAGQLTETRGGEGPGDWVTPFSEGGGAGVGGGVDAGGDVGGDASEDVGGDVPAPSVPQEKPPGWDNGDWWF